MELDMTRAWNVVACWWTCQALLTSSSSVNQSDADFILDIDIVGLDCSEEQGEGQRRKLLWGGSFNANYFGSSNVGFGSGQATYTTSAGTVIQRTMLMNFGRAVPFCRLS